jgi:Tol biopolymer transport system component
MRRSLAMAGVAALTVSAVVACGEAGQATPATHTASSTRTSRIAFVRTSPDGSTVRLYTASPDGSGVREVPLANPAETWSSAVWSPDGTKLLISHTFRLNDAGNCCLPFRPAIVNANGSGFTQLTMAYAPPGLDCTAWSEDGARILCGFGGAHPGVFSVRASDGGAPVRLTTNPFRTADQEAGDTPTSVSPEGKRFIFIRFHPGAGGRRETDKTTALFVANLDGTHLNQITPYGLTAAHEDVWASWSPDGREILSVAAGRPGHTAPILCPDVFFACFSRTSQLFTVHPDGSGFHRIQLDSPAGYARVGQPSWSPDGSRIVFWLWPKGGGAEDI